MKKVIMYSNNATLLGFNNFMMFQKKMLLSSLHNFVETASEVNIKEYEHFKTFSAELIMVDTTLTEGNGV
jgi:hypothetical protein